eukprot:scaffold8023_cov103-Isochrysis_galbana.AAC.13
MPSARKAGRSAVPGSEPSRARSRSVKARRRSASLGPAGGSRAGRSSRGSGTNRTASSVPTWCDVCNRPGAMPRRTSASRHASTRACASRLTAFWTPHMRSTASGWRSSAAARPSKKSSFVPTALTSHDPLAKRTPPTAGLRRCSATAAASSIASRDACASADHPAPPGSLSSPCRQRA